MLKPTARRVAILGGNRLPFARMDGVYAKTSNQELMTEALRGLVERFNLQDVHIGEVIGGAVMKHAHDYSLTRQSVLDSGLAMTTPAEDVQQACATSLAATINIANKIASGQIESGIACGSEVLSDPPIGFGEGVRRIAMDLRRGPDFKSRARAVAKLRPWNFEVVDIPENAEPRTGMSMGESQALTNLQWGATRQEQDELTARSHHNLAAAYDRGFYDDLITPYLGLQRDNNLRPNSSVEALAKLKPCFGGPDGTMTAGNSTPLTDGAATVLLSSVAWAKERGIKPLGYLVTGQTGAVDFIEGDDGLLSAPFYVVPTLLQRAGLEVDDIDYFDFHEAFAGQVVSSFHAWKDKDFAKRLGRKKIVGEIPAEKINPVGGSIAAGHPFGATGARMVASMAKHLNEQGKGTTGLVSICAAGGLGTAALIEAA